MKICVFASIVSLFLFCGISFAQHHKVSQVTIDVRDYCDPDSFNTAIGPGTCVRDTANGEITFSGSSLN